MKMMLMKICVAIYVYYDIKLKIKKDDKYFFIAEFLLKLINYYIL